MMTTLNDNVKWGVEFVADMLMNSLYKKDALEEERYTIYEEVYNTRYERQKWLSE